LANNALLYLSSVYVCTLKGNNVDHWWSSSTHDWSICCALTVNI